MTSTAHAQVASPRPFLARCPPVTGQQPEAPEAPEAERAGDAKSRKQSGLFLRPGGDHRGVSAGKPPACVDTGVRGSCEPAQEPYPFTEPTRLDTHGYQPWHGTPQGVNGGNVRALRRAGDAGGFAAMEAHLRRVAALVPGAWVGPAGDA